MKPDPNLNPFEQELQAALPKLEISPTLKQSLRAQLNTAPTPSRAPSRPRRWAFALAPLMIILAIVLALGPHKVWAQLQRALGFLPGHGLVDQSVPLRTLIEPVSQTREGITVEVTGALLSGSETTIEFRVFGLSAANRPAQESDPSCRQQPQLLLPDGSVYQLNGPAFPALPATVDQATFILPCLAGTNPATTPGDWQFPLAFSTRTDSVAILPVETLLPEPTLVVATQAEPEPAIELGLSIEIPRGYIVAGWLQLPENRHYQALEAKLFDADGKLIQQQNPQEINNLINSPELQDKQESFVAAFNSQGLAFPITIQKEIVPILQTQSQESTTFQVDVGAAPQAAQTWEVHQELVLEGMRFTLKEFLVVGDTGYKFFFDAPASLAGLDIVIDGHQAVGSGGGGNLLATGSSQPYSQSLVFETLPTGVLNITLSGLRQYGDPQTLTQTWEPAAPHAPYPERDPAKSVCLVASKAADLQALPVYPHKLIILEHGLDPTTGKHTGYAKTNQADSPLFEIPDAIHGSLSSDGTQAVSMGEENGIYGAFITDLADGSRVFVPANGISLHLSPDSRYLAYAANTDAGYGIPAIYDLVTNTHVALLSDFTYTYIAGWSADSQTVYFTAPYLSSPSWKVISYPLSTQETAELVTIENATPKALRPEVSPDGRWLTYRGQDNSSLILVSLEDQSSHVVFDNSQVLNAEWLDDQSIAVSLKDENQEYHLLIADVYSCELTRVEGAVAEMIDARPAP